MVDPILICLVGGGRAGQVHANSLVHHVRDGRIAAVVDTDIASLQATGDKFSIATRFLSLEEALAQCSFDAVVITTPTFTHRHLAVLAARNGKHVLCEKPMALNLEECEEMIDTAEQHRVILQIGFMRRFDPDFELAAARIEAGEIGRPMVIKSLTHGPGLPPSWARDLKTSNGMLAEVNSHDWDSLRWLSGSNPTRVFADVANFKGEERNVTTEHFYDTALVQVKFESGALGSISGVCPCEYGYDARVEIIGERGILQIGDLRGHSVVMCTNRERGLVTPIFQTWPHRFASAYVREMDHFVSCIQRGAQPRVNGIDGRFAVACVLAATRSFQEDRPVRLTELLQPAIEAKE